MGDSLQYNISPERAAAARSGAEPYYPKTEDDVTIPIKEEEVPTSTEKVEEEAAKETTPPPQPPPKADVEEGLPLEAWLQEYNETGELSAESTTQAADAIFNPSLDPALKEQLLRQYLEGIDAAKGMAHLHAWDTVGGKETFDTIIEWARKPESLPDDERAELNKQLSGSASSQKIALELLKARYEAASGRASEPDLGHGSSNTSGVPVVASRAQLREIVRSEQYKKDPVYRDQIDAQLARSMKSQKYRIS